MDSNDELKEIDMKNRTCYYFDDLIKIEDFYLDNILIDEKSYKNILTVCSYHVMYVFQSESTLYSCLNVKELLARNRRDI